MSPGQVQVNGMLLTYAPAAAQGGRTVTILAKANNGYSDSEEAVTVVITVQPQPSSLFQVEFTANGGSPAPSPQTVVDGGKAIEPAAMSRTGYDFTGWFMAGTPETAWNFTTPDNQRRDHTRSRLAKDPLSDHVPSRGRLK